MATFTATQCHNRDAAGKPNCKKDRWLRKSGEGFRGNLCETHEVAWRKAAAARYAASKPAAVKPAKAPAKPKVTMKRPAKGVVVPLLADDQPLDPMTREIEAVRRMKEAKA